DWIGGSSGRTSSSDRVADRCKAAAAFAGDFSVSDRAHGSCRAGADYSGLFGRPLGLRRGARDRGDAADGDTLSRASRRIRGDRGAGRSAACGTRSRVMTAEAKTWLVALACRKAKELGYPHELWTTRLLAAHARQHGPTAGHPSLA